jgi:hypothetical protein
LFIAKRIAIVIIFSLFLQSASKTGAYILESSRLLDLMTQSLGPAKSLLLVQKVRVVSQNKIDEHKELTETVRYLFSKAFRADIVSGYGHRIRIVNRHHDITLLNNTPVTASRLDDYVNILLYQDPKILAEKLSYQGIDLSITSLGRFRGKVVYVIGAAFPDKTVSQLWVEKESFKPCRWLIYHAPGESMDIHFLEWQQFQNRWHPMKIQFYDNHRRIREIESQTVKTDPVFDDELFFVDESFLEEGVSKPKTTLTDVSEEIRLTIESFRNLYR